MRKESPLTAYLKNRIRQHGPMDVGEFMAIALGHPQHGYYMKQDPFGAAGDFTTAPEISQMFGEMIGAWAADLWVQMGRPAAFGLLECGPGRGTLMADMMRAGAAVEGFTEACRVHLLEMSPVLRAVQEKTLQGYAPQWHETLESVPRDYPLIVIGNEFLDALPLRQLVKTDTGWSERVISTLSSLRKQGSEMGDLGPCFRRDDSEDEFCWGVKATSPNLLTGVSDAPEGSIFEVSPARSGFIMNLCTLMQTTGGAALFIDYGHARSGLGDTFQALHKHQFCDVLSHVGDADLTSHVDFQAVQEAAAAKGAALWGVVEQGAFLKALGIDHRAQYLAGRGDEAQQENIKTALHRLTASDQMGSLFKVTGFFYGANIHPAGF